MTFFSHAVSIETKLLLLLTFAMIGCAEHRVSPTLLPEKVAGTEVNAHEPKFVFIAPDGFEWSDANRIWHNKSTNTSIALAHEPGRSFQSVVDDFVPERMLASGLELIDKETLYASGRATLLIKGNRLNVRVPQQFCTVAFGTDLGCAQITAIYPTDSSDRWKNKIEASLLESRYEMPK
jgi:hypothetical protein